VFFYDKKIKKKIQNKNKNYKLINNCIYIISIILDWQYSILMHLINKLINKILINPAYTTNKCSQKSIFFHNNANLEFVWNNIYIYIYILNLYLVWIINFPN
jgi:hypothetical protein